MSGDEVFGQSFVRADNTIKVKALISTLLGGFVVLAGSILTQISVTIVRLHLWAFLQLGRGVAGFIRAVTGGAAFVNVQAWEAAYQQSQSLGVMAPWFLAIDFIAVAGIVLLARRYGPIP